VIIITPILIIMLIMMMIVIIETLVIIPTPETLMIQKIIPVSLTTIMTLVKMILSKMTMKIMIKNKIK